MVRIGVDVGGTSIKIGVVDEEGRILCHGSVTTRTDLPFSEQIAQMAACAKEVLQRSGHTMDEVASIGAGVPGVADPKTGVVVFCTNLGWHDVPFRAEFQKYFNVPIFIDNDATVAGLAESVAGVSKGAGSSVFLTLGTGVGGGIVINGKVWSGAHGVGSEIGHMILELDGEPCTCGNHGCVERYCSATAIIRKARELLLRHPDSLILAQAEGDPAKINARIVIDCAREGDAIALKVFRWYVKNLAQTIASIIHFLDPEVIVLGGGVCNAGAFLLDAVREEVPRYLLFKNLPYSDIKLAELGSDAGMIGAAMLS